VIFPKSCARCSSDVLFHEALNGPELLCLACGFRPELQERTAA